MAGGYLKKKWQSQDQPELEREVMPAVSELFASTLRTAKTVATVFKKLDVTDSDEVTSEETRTGKIRTLKKCTKVKIELTLSNLQASFDQVQT